MENSLVQVSWIKTVQIQSVSIDLSVCVKMKRGFQPPLFSQRAKQRDTLTRGLLLFPGRPIGCELGPSHACQHKAMIKMLRAAIGSVFFFFNSGAGGGGEGAGLTEKPNYQFGVSALDGIAAVSVSCRRE